jgi:surface antigen
MYNRESVSYAAWKVNETFGNMPTLWTGQCNITTSAPNGPPSVKSYPDGDAICWPHNAQNAGFTIGLTPKVHSVGITTIGQYASTGFSVWVEAVNGNQVTVSSYNSDGSGTYNVQVVPAATFLTYIYF